MCCWPRSWLVVLTLTSMISVSAIPQNGALASNQSLTTIEESLQRHHIALTTTALVGALRSSDADVRWLAAQKLANDRASDSIPAIKKALAVERVPATKVNIAYAVAQMGEAKGLAALKSTCFDANVRGYLRMLAALYMLNLHNEECLSAAVTILQSKADPDSRVQALSLLPRFQNASVAYSRKISSLILVTLADRTPAVRIAASNALSTLGSTSAIPYLQRAIASERDEVVRSSMQTDLKKLRQKREN